ncbi:hypothetical protein SeMB42_g07106 [Synchytrium endobioticum]|uniref:Uncharacterized protein n=1 Tax=Synchytrium endobioticum TaxID=286115 RepID=A0A507C5X9_9FUNG|nr:hypothetical protein SeMB42_g07106 [Synchytrium endobioticum]TPX36427.1 hypothetical protein SeLEV6574_g08052 [Synchytrium endobioticum]
MGCKGSKPKVAPAEMAGVPKGKKVSPDPETLAEVSARKTDNKGIDKTAPLPSIPKNVQRPTTARAIAFTIPFDEDPVTKSHTTINKRSLPSLNLDVSNKLANAEARWQELDSKSSLKFSADRKRPVPGNLTKKTDRDADELREKLLERDKKAEENRIKHLQNKKAVALKKDKYADEVRERAKTRNDGEENDDEIEYGGEGDEEDEK